MAAPVSVQPLLPFDTEPPAPPPPAPGRRASPALCREHPLDEKILVAPSLADRPPDRRASRARRELPGSTSASRRCARSPTASSAPELAREGLRLLSRAQSLALVEQACAEALGPDSYFGGLATGPDSTARSRRPSTSCARPASLPIGCRPGRLRTARNTARSAGSLPSPCRGARARPRRRRDRSAPARPRSPRGETGERPRRPAGAHLPAASRRRARAARAANSSRSSRRPAHRARTAEPGDAWTPVARGARLFRAIGEENEIREIFRRDPHGRDRPSTTSRSSTPIARVYPALVWELSREHDIPCTFAGRDRRRRSRARAARRSRFSTGSEATSPPTSCARRSPRARCSLESVGAEPVRPGPGPPRARCGGPGIGWGRDRHRRVPRPSRRGAREAGERRGAAMRTRAPEEAARRHRRARRRDRDAARDARRFLVARVRARAGAPPTARRICRHSPARRAQFVGEFGRVADPLDATARTALDALLRGLRGARARARSPWRRPSSVCATPSPGSRSRPTVRAPAASTSRTTRPADSRDGGTRLPRRPRRGRGIRAATSKTRSSSTRSAAASTRRSPSPAARAAARRARRETSRRRSRACVARLRGN